MSLKFCLLKEKKRKIEIKKVKEGKGKSSCCTLIIIIIIIIIINFFYLGYVKKLAFLKLNRPSFVPVKLFG